MRLYKVGDFIRNLLRIERGVVKGEFSSNDTNVCFRSIFNCKLTEALSVCICFWNTRCAYSLVLIFRMLFATNFSRVLRFDKIISSKMKVILTFGNKNMHNRIRIA